MTRRARTPRKTPPGPKPLSLKVADEDLERRNELVERRESLEQIRQEAAQALAELEGERKFWRRTVIDPKYGMAPNDIIGPDGTIERVGQEG